MTPQEERAFGARLAALQPKLVGYAQSLNRRGIEEAEDIASEAVMKAWRARHSFQTGTNLKAWLWTITRNVFLSERRRDRWKGGQVDDLALDLLPTQPAGQELRLHLGDAISALDRIPAAQAEAVVLIGLGESYEDAADEIGCALGTLKSRTCRGRDALAAELAREPIAA